MPGRRAGSRPVSENEPRRAADLSDQI
jgi:hypothetical protein